MAVERAAAAEQHAAKITCNGPLRTGLGNADEVAEAPRPAPQNPAAPAAGVLSLHYGGEEHTFEDVPSAKLFLLLSLVADSSDFDAVEVEAQSPRQHRQASLQRFKAKKHGRSHVKAEEDQKPRKLAPSREALPFSSGGRTSSSDGEGGGGSGGGRGGLGGGGKCVNCGVAEEDTPLMRRGPAGPHTLCNACGLMYASHGVMRTPPGSRSRGQNPCRGKHVAAPAAAPESTRVLSLSHGFGQPPLQQPAGSPPLAPVTTSAILLEALSLPQAQLVTKPAGTPAASAAAAAPLQLFVGAAASAGFAAPGPASGGMAAAGCASFVDSAAAASSPFTVPVMSVAAGLPTACSTPTSRPPQPLQDLPGVLDLGMVIDKATPLHDAGGCSTKEKTNDQGMTRAASGNGLVLGGSLQRTPWSDVAV